MSILSRRRLLAFAVYTGVLGAVPLVFPPLQVLAASHTAEAQPSSEVVFTANETGNSISIVDPETGQVETVEIDVSPHNIQATPDGRSLLAVGSVPEEDQGHEGAGHAGDVDRGRLLIFDTNDVASGPTDDIQVGRHPAHVIADEAGRAFVTNSGDNTLAIFDIEGETDPTVIPVGQSPHGLRISPDGSEIYVANTGDGSVSVISTADLTEIARVPVGAGPVQVGFTPDGNEVYVSLRDENGVAVLDRQTRQVTRTITVGSGPIQVFATPDGSAVYVANQGTEEAPGKTVSVIDTESGDVMAEIETGVGAHGVAISQGSAHAYVTNIWGDTLSVINTDNQSVIRTLPVGDGPNGVTVIPTSR